MTRRDFEEFQKKFCEKTSKLMHTRKADEYASLSNDRLNQFKRIATMTGLSPATVCFVLMAKHITSLADLTNQPIPNNSLIEEKLTDLHNYTVLLAALFKERVKGDTKEVSNES